MAKQKSGKNPNPSQKKVEQNEAGSIVNFRSTDDNEANAGRQAALKCGACRVGTRPVDLEQVESFAEFRSKSGAKAFRNSWLKNRKKSWPVVEDLAEGG
ncbi:MAG: hypothetical protein IKE91_02335 [Clostridia bacterium]|nr:hypothetical protein [Clostridia bacterium]